MALVDVKVVPNAQFLPTIYKMVNGINKEIAQELADEMQAAVSVPFPPASAPGQPPRRRTGETARSIKTKKLGDMDWAVYMAKQSPGRENLGIWLELGTGSYRQPFPSGSEGRVTGEYASPGPGKTSMQARPFMLKTLTTRGPQIAKSKFSGASQGFFGRVLAKVRGFLGF